MDYQDEFAEEELTEEEKEYLKAFCDLDDLCLVCPPFMSERADDSSAMNHYLSTMYQHSTIRQSI